MYLNLNNTIKDGDVNAVAYVHFTDAKLDLERCLPFQSTDNKQRKVWYITFDVSPYTGRFLL